MSKWMFGLVVAGVLSACTDADDGGDSGSGNPGVAQLSCFAVGPEGDSSVWLRRTEGCAYVCSIGDQVLFGEQSACEAENPGGRCGCSWEVDADCAVWLQDRPCND